MPEILEVGKLDRKHEELQREGYTYWNSYNTRPEMEHATKNLRHWGSKVKVLHYPNGTYVVMQKEGYKK